MDIYGCYKTYLKILSTIYYITMHRNKYQHLIITQETKEHFTYGVQVLVIYYYHQQLK